MPKIPTANGDSHSFNQKFQTFLRNLKPNKEKDTHHGGIGSTPSTPSLRTDNTSTSHKPGRQTKFFSVGRLRSTTVASEGHILDEHMSPTANANPYFAHQGQPGLRHHNAGSVPPSPPDTPTLKIDGPNGGPVDQPTAATKEELARKLRRVASAPNAQGLFAKSGGQGSSDRPATAELTKEPLVGSKDSNTLGLAESENGTLVDSPDGLHQLSVPEADGLGALPPPVRVNGLAFRRTYSSNSIKVRDVEVGPQSFDKIKLIGKGDVGKVYLVREKKSSRLYAMKGLCKTVYPLKW
jgi:protein-serine/threonine kinase